MKTITPVFVIIALLFCVSCKSNKKSSNELAYRILLESNIPISSISPAQGSDVILFVGLENGNIIEVNVRTDERKLISTEFNSRIYDIIQEEDTLWVGVRNHGLLKFVYENDSLELERTYKIPVFDRGYTSNYSPYDIEMDKDSTLFLGTSSGVYRLNKNERENNTLTPIYPTDSEIVHFRVNQVKTDDYFIYCATESGLVILSKGGVKQPFSGVGENVSHLFLKNDTLLFATTAAQRYGISVKDTIRIIDSTSVPVDGLPLFAYIADSISEGKWEFTAKQINYSNKDGELLPFGLPERMSPNYRNYLHLGEDFLFFSQGNKLFSFPLRQNTKGESNHIIAAHTSGDTCYFISNDNNLYSYSQDVVKWLGSIGNSFSDGENIIQMCKSDNYLWFITDKESLYKINLAPSRFTFRQTYEAIKDTLKGDFTALLYDRGSLYVGSRHVLYRIHDLENKNGRRETNIFDRIDKPKEDLYVTDIVQRDGEIYISTLNYGFFQVDTTSLAEITDTIGSIYKMTAQDTGISLFSSKGFFRYHHREGITELNALPNENLKLIHTTFGKYYAGYQGIGNLDYAGNSVGVEELSYVDMSFNKAAITKGIEVGTILLGSQTGLYEYDGEVLEPIIILPPPDDSPRLVTGLLLFFVIIAFGCFWCINFYSGRKDMTERLKQCKEKSQKNIRKEIAIGLNDDIKDLNERLNSLKIINITEFRQLKKDINAFYKKIDKKLINRKGVIDQLKKQIENKIDEINENIKESDDNEEWRDILTEKEEIWNEDSEGYSITKFHDLFDRILAFEKKHFKRTIINLQGNNLEIDHDLEKIYDLITTYDEPYEELKSKLNEFIKKYSDNELSGLRFVHQNNTKSFVTVLLCTGLKNKEIKKALDMLSHQHPSMYYKDIKNVIEKIHIDDRSNLVQKVLDGIKDRGREKKE
jgi:hypothetical protein